MIIIELFSDGSLRCVAVELTNSFQQIYIVKGYAILHPGKKVRMALC